MSLHPSRREFLGGLSALAAAGITGATVSGCGNDSTGGSTSRELRYQYSTGKVPPDLPAVNKAINELLAERGKDFTVRLEPLDNEVWKTRLPLQLTAGEAGDLLFTATWSNSYFVNAANDYYLELDDLLPKHAPTLWEMYTPEIWDAARYQGKIYGAINQQLFPHTWGIQVRKDLADKYSLNMDAINAPKDLEPFYTEVAGAEKDIKAVYSSSDGRGTPANNLYYGYDDIGYNLVFDPADPALTLKVFTETDEYAEFVNLMYRWRKLGFFTETPLGGDEARAAWVNGKTASNFAQAIRPDASITFDIVEKPLLTPMMTTNAVLATMTGVNADVEHPQDAVAWLELINSDVELYNLLCFGIKDKHWEFEDEALKLIKLPDGVTAETGKYVVNQDWMYGNQFNAYYRSRADAESKRWDRELDFNKSATNSSGLGFALNPEAVKTEVANIAAVMTEYQVPLAVGLTEPGAALAKLNDQLKAAGIETVKAEAEKQITEWLSSR